MNMDTLTLSRTTFLTPSEIPANLTRLQTGDRVRVVTSRAFVRAGYRLSGPDLYPEVEAALSGPQGEPLVAAFLAFNHGLGSGRERPRKLSRRTRERLTQVLAWDLVSAWRFGGPERGIHVSMDGRLDPKFIKLGPWGPRSTTPIPTGTEVVVGSTYTVRVGTYYAGSNWQPPYYDDAEPGGLSDPRTIVVVVPLDRGTHLLSGDLERA